MRRTFKKPFIMMIVFLLAFSMLSGCGGGGGSSGGVEVIKVGSKDFSEQLILAQLAIQILEANGLKVEDRSNVSGSDTCRKALETGEFGMYWEYTGTAWMMLLQNEPFAGTPQAMYERLKEIDAENNLVWLEYAPFNNTYALAMPEARAKELGITSFTELGAYIKANPGELVLACDHEFTARPDGLPGLVETYGHDFGNNISIMEMGIVFRTLRDGLADVAMVHSTDGRNIQYNLTLLDDDKNFFPIYNPAPCVRKDVLEKFPEIEDILKKVSSRLTTEIMQGLNFRVDGEGLEPREVAAEWLKAEGLI